MLKPILAIAIAICSIASATAQSNYTIAGKVQDSLHRPIDLATAILHTLPDSAIIKGAYTDSLGNYTLAQLAAGSYYIELSSQGYNTWTSNSITLSPTQPIASLPVATLYTTATGLKELQVTARRAFVVHKADRTQVNVDAMLSSAGSNALEVLEKCPGVQVDQNGSISLRGKQGVTIFINDKPTYMSGDDLASYLRSLPAAVLDQIELMTNPPAQYDAAGNAGIINIKIKRKGTKGFNGGLNLNYTQGQLTRSNNSINLNYRYNKVNAYFNLGYNFGDNFTDLDLHRTYNDAAGAPRSYFNQNSYFFRHGDAGMLNTGADYNYSDKSTIGIALSGMSNRSSSVNDNTSRLLNAANDLDSVIIAKNNNHTDATNGSININYRTQFNTSGHGLTADADYVTYSTTTNQSFYNDGYLPNGTPQYKELLTGHLPNHINIYALKTDYTLPLTSGWKFESGLKASFTETDNKAEYYNTSNNTTLPDYNKSNQFIYKENINAAYINFSREFGKFSLQSGLRVENTASDGHQLGNAQKPDSAFTRNYTNAFPTVFLSYRFDTLSVHQLNINYGRRIDRPYYQDLNPFVNPMDKFTYYVGNPFLKPSFNHSVQLTHTYKNKISTSLSYSKSVDDVNETIEIVNGIYYSRSGNIGSKTSITLSVDADFDPTKWLHCHIYSEMGNLRSTGAFYSGTINTSGTYGYIGVNMIATGRKGWSGELNGNYRSRITDAQFVINTLWGANLVVQKKLNDAASLKLGLNDIFYTRKIVGEIGNLTQATAGWINRSDSRCASLTFSYRFGKAFTNTARHDQSSADAEKQRVKN